MEFALRGAHLPLANAQRRRPGWKSSATIDISHRASYSSKRRRPDPASPALAGRDGIRIRNGWIGRSTGVRGVNAVARSRRKLPNCALLPSR